MSVSVMQVDDGIVLPDKASLYLTAIEDADYKDDKIECELINTRHLYNLAYLIFSRCFISAFIYVARNVIRIVQLYMLQFFDVASLFNCLLK